FDLLVEAPADAGRLYLAPASWGSSPGIFLSPTRWLGLQYDSLFVYSLASSNPHFANTVGTLDAQGRAHVTITIPADVALPAYTFYFAAMTVDLASPDGLGKISTTLQVDVAH